MIPAGKIEAALAHERTLLVSAEYRNVHWDAVSCRHAIRILERLLDHDTGRNDTAG